MVRPWGGVGAAVARPCVDTARSARAPTRPAPPQAAAAAGPAEGRDGLARAAGLTRECPRADSDEPASEELWFYRRALVPNGRL